MPSRESTLRPRVRAGVLTCSKGRHSVQRPNAFAAHGCISRVQRCRRCSREAEGERWMRAELRPEEPGTRGRLAMSRRIRPSRLAHGAATVRRGAAASRPARMPEPEQAGVPDFSSENKNPASLIQINAITNTANRARCTSPGTGAGRGRSASRDTIAGQDRLNLRFNP